MPRKFTERYLKPENWNFKRHFLAGTEWSVAGSKKDSFYTVALTESGFTCSCPGFQFHGRCKHSAAVIQRFDD